MNTSTIRFAVALCSLGAALPASAGDIRAQLPPELIYSHCQKAGVGSETEGTFMLPSGRITGSVLCTQEDLVASKMAPARRYDDDEDHGRLDDEDDDGGENDDRDD